MSSESEAQKHYAMPRLMGQPAYTRRRYVEVAPRPLDPDDLPLEAFRTDEEHDLVASLTDVARRPAESPAQLAAPRTAAPDEAPAATGIVRRLGFRR